MKETNLPENAFRELKEGEQYEPLMKPGRTYREVTPWSIFWGLLMAVIFSAATAYLGLKVGQVFEAAIPITIIAVGLSGATHRKDPLGENVIKIPPRLRNIIFVWAACFNAFSRTITILFTRKAYD